MGYFDKFTGMKCTGKTDRTGFLYDCVLKQYCERFTTEPKSKTVTDSRKCVSTNNKYFVKASK